MDQLIKFVALSSLTSYQTTPIIQNVFHLTLIRNQGVAFGFFREHPQFLFILITLSLLVLIVWSFSIWKSLSFAKWGVALIIGGAIGNWIDRLRHGAVIDYLDFRVWPVFNFADSCISVGVVLYLIFTFFPKKKA